MKLVVNTHDYSFLLIQAPVPVLAVWVYISTSELSSMYMGITLNFAPVHELWHSGASKHMLCPLDKAYLLAQLRMVWYFKVVPDPNLVTPVLGYLS